MVDTHSGSGGHCWVQNSGITVGIYLKITVMAHATVIIMWTRSGQVVSGLDSLPAIGSREEHNGEKGGQISRQINLALEELD